MQFGHLGVRCGQYRILLPGENIAAINEVSDEDLAPLSIHQARRFGWLLVLDTRILLGLDREAKAASSAGAKAAPRIDIRWHASDGLRRAVLRVDGVDGLRHDDAADVLPLPRVPANVRGLFDGLVRDGGNGFLLQLRRDVCPALDTASRRARFVRAVLGALEPRQTDFKRLEP